MDFGSFVISSSSIESLSLLFQRTSNGKYNAFHHGWHPTTATHAHRHGIPGSAAQVSGAISAPKGPKAQLIPYRIIWITKSVFSANRYWVNSS